jgi:hypothetical protein
VHQLLNADSWPTFYNSKIIRHFGILKFLNQCQNRWEANNVLQVVVLPTTHVHPPRYGLIHTITFVVVLNTNQHEVTIKDFLACTCTNFITMMASLLGG